MSADTPPLYEVGRRKRGRKREGGGGRRQEGRWKAEGGGKKEERIRRSEHEDGRRREKNHADKNLQLPVRIFYAKGGV